MIPSSVWLLFGDEEHEWFEHEADADEACEDSNLDVEEGYELAFVEEYVPRATLDAALAELGRCRAMEAVMRKDLECLLNYYPPSLTDSMRSMLNRYLDMLKDQPAEQSP